MSICSTFTHRLASAAGSDNATNVRDRGTRVLCIRGDNAAAAKRYLKLYDKATAPLSTDTPRAVFVLPASASFNFCLPAALAFVKGMGYRITTGAADADTGALTAADIIQLNIDLDA